MPVIHENPHDYLLLESISQKEPELRKTKLKIFFVQTSENELVLARHACSIESAARLHPNGRIFVLLRSKYVHLNKGSQMHLRSYENIFLLHFNEYDIYSGTPLEQLNQTTVKKYIPYFSMSHMSDFIRTALLYKYGGIYFDLDVIVLQNFHIFTNAVALETRDSVNVAVLIFEKQHAILELQMDIQLQLSKRLLSTLCWNCFGPLALTDALKTFCDQRTLYINHRNRCHQIDIQPSYVFYPISYQVNILLDPE